MRKSSKLIAGCIVAAPLALALALPAGASVADVGASAASVGTVPPGLPVAQIVHGNAFSPAYPPTVLAVLFASASVPCSRTNASFVIENVSGATQQVTYRTGYLGSPMTNGSNLYVCLYHNAHDARTFSLASNPYAARLRVHPTVKPVG